MRKLKAAVLALVTLIIAAAAASAALRVRDPRRAAASFIQSGDRYVKSGQLDAADIEYRNAIKAMPSSVEAHARLLEVVTRRRDANAVAQEIAALANLKPDDLEAQLRAGEMYARMGRWVEAESVLRRAHSLRSDHPAVNRALAVLCQRAGRTSEAEAYWKAVAESPGGDPFALADYHIARRRFSEAESELRALMENAHDRDAARLRLAAVLHAQGNIRASDRLLDAAFAGQRRDPAPWLLRGRLRLAEQKPADAYRAYASALDTDPDSLEALAGLTALDLAAKRYEAAIARLEHALARMPENTSLLMIAAQTYAAAGKAAQSEDAFKRIIQRNPAHLPAYAGLGDLYLRQGRLDNARDEFGRLAEHQPADVSAPTMIGMILEAQQKQADAQAQYEAVVSKHPQAAVAANNLAWMYMRQGRHDEALRLALAARDEMRLPQINDTLGWIYYQKNDPTNAIPPLAASVQAQPDNPLYHYHLGLAYLKAGREAAARSELAAAIVSPAKFDGKADAERLAYELSVKERDRGPAERH